MNRLRGNSSGLIYVDLRLVLIHAVIKIMKIRVNIMGRIIMEN
jgi:hypothetical protein